MYVSHCYKKVVQMLTTGYLSAMLKSDTEKLIIDYQSRILELVDGRLFHCGEKEVIL